MLETMLQKVKNTIRSHLSGTLFIILTLLWLGFGYLAYRGISIPELQRADNDTKTAKTMLDYLNASYVAAGALFTGLAFTITFLNLKHQKEELQNQNERLSQQISIDVFSDAFGHVLEVDRFRESKKYILSNQFKEAVDDLVSHKSPSIKFLIDQANAEFQSRKREIEQGNDKESIDERISMEREKHNKVLLGIRKSCDYKATMEQLCIEDFKKTKVSIISTEEEYDKQNESNLKNEDKTNDASNYQMILYFCDRMEYLGFIYNTYCNSAGNTGNDDKNRNLILDYFGFDIINTFEILKPFIHANREESNSGNPYYHFEFLYLLATKRKKDYLKDCEDELIRLSK